LLIGFLLSPPIQWFLDKLFGEAVFRWLMSLLAGAPEMLLSGFHWLASNWTQISWVIFLLWVAYLLYQMWRETRPILGPVPSGPLSERPPATLVGQAYRATDTGTLYFNQGDGWQEVVPQRGEVTAPVELQAWAILNLLEGMPDLVDSYNVSGFTDNGVRDFTLSWDQNFPDTNYDVFVNPSSALADREVVYPGFVRIRLRQDNVSPEELRRLVVLAVNRGRRGSGENRVAGGDDTPDDPATGGNPADA
jgi:hypothetical protein